MDITGQVYVTLSESTDEIAKDVAKYTKLQDESKSGKLTEKGIKEDLWPAMNDLRIKIRNDSEAAIRKAENMVAEYRKNAARLNDLDPELITNDIKLLQAGVSLLPRDLEAILERNKGNRTMTQLALRYAKQHDIDLTGIQGKYAIRNEEEETAKRLDGILHYYSRWIDKGNAKTVLDKFFGVSE